MLIDEPEKRHLLQQELFEKNSLLKKFIYSCSHDLKGPLASIKGLTHLAERSPGGTVEYLHLINESIARMDHCLKSLESLMSNSWEPVYPSEVDFMEIIKGSLNRHTDDIKKYRINTTIHGKQEKRVISDALRIQVVIDHLLQNAITFQIPSKSPKLIDIEVRTIGDHVKIEICDNGEGIAKNHIPDIFNIFYRSSEASKGSGLGLYIVKETLTKLNGEISVISSKNVGSNFIVKIPIMPPTSPN